jgi:dihydrofolate reductase
MRKLFLFMMVSLDGFFEGPAHELDWHVVDAEFNEFAARQLDEADMLLFGRVTYQLMASYWPTDLAKTDDPIVTQKMNSLPKIVFSRTLAAADWNNTKLIKENVAAEVARLKQQPGKDLVILGSSNLCISLLRLGLIDELRIMVNPVVLGSGKTLFDGMNSSLKLKLLTTRTFTSGNVLLYYRPL